MNIPIRPMIEKYGPCPRCLKPATRSSVHFDSRNCEVACSSCGRFRTCKAELDDADGRQRKEAAKP